MLSEIIAKHNKGVLTDFRGLQFNFPLARRDAHDAAKIAIGNVIKALSGVVPEEKVLAAVGNARSPNAVSRALRTRVSPRFFN